MLAIATIFLVTFVTSVTAIWVYRKISGWSGFSASLVGRPRASARMKIGAQHGFISLYARNNKGVKQVKLRGSRKNIKTPWGW